MKKAILLLVIIALVILAYYIRADKKIGNKIEQENLFKQGFSQEEIVIIQKDMTNANN